MNKGDVYESPGGMSFTIKKVLKDSVTVDVQRNYRDKDGKFVLRVNERVVPKSLFASFARAYEKV